MTVDKLISTAKKEGRTALTEIESKKILTGAGIECTEIKLAKTSKEAITAAKKFGFPVALKIVSPNILHKTDIGGVKLNLSSEEEVGQAFDEIIGATKKHNPKAKIDGVSVQPMARPGIEVIIGMNKDQQFGPVLMFGLGGILVEVLKDVSFRIVPLIKRDAREMIKEIKGYPILQGYRGHEPANIEILEDILLKVSEFVENQPEIKELDINPIFAYRDSALALDARIILEPWDNSLENAMKRLERAFNPRSVAVVGDKMALGYMWLKSLAHFQGKLYSVQIDEREFPGIASLGVKNYLRLQDIPDEIDYAVIAVPNTVTPRIIRDCIDKNVGAAALFTSGFAESGTDEGRKLQDTIAKIARDADFNLIGPNCMGIYNPRIGLSHSMDQMYGRSGNVAFISQSGTHATFFSLVGPINGIYISKSVSYGNAAVLDSTDYLEYFGNDAETEIIGIYIEGVNDGRKFFSCLKEVARRKPVVIWKGGISDEGRRAASSHTSSLAGSPAIWDALIKQCGAIKAENLNELIDTIKLLLHAKPTAGNRVGLAAMTGGQSVVITDAFTREAAAERSFI